MRDILPDVTDYVRTRTAAVRELGQTAIGVPTGFVKLDGLLGTLQPGIHLLAAAPGQGKTTFALQIASNAARSGIPAFFVSFEERIERLALKVVCQSAGLETKRLNDGMGDPDELEQAAKKVEQELGDRLRFIEGTQRLTVGIVRQAAREAMESIQTHKCLVVVDYLQYMASAQQDYSNFRHKVARLNVELREMALALDSPVLVISSQNRIGQGGASMTSLKESGDLEYSADSILFLVKNESRDDVFPPLRAIDLKVVKNRYGDVDTMEMVFEADRGVFREVESSSSSTKDEF